MTHVEVTLTHSLLIMIHTEMQLLTHCFLFMTHTERQLLTHWFLFMTLGHSIPWHVAGALQQRECQGNYKVLIQPHYSKLE